MKKYFVLSLVLVTSIIFYAKGDCATLLEPMVESRVNASMDRVGRYQIFIGPGIGFQGGQGSGVSVSDTFMLDTATGRTWIYQRDNGRWLEAFKYTAKKTVIYEE